MKTLKTRMYNWYVYAVVCIIMAPLIPVSILVHLAEFVANACVWAVSDRWLTNKLGNAAENFARRRGVEL